MRMRRMTNKRVAAKLHVKKRREEEKKQGK
jgi:hypothetical protein